MASDKEQADPLVEALRRHVGKHLRWVDAEGVECCSCGWAADSSGGIWEDHLAAILAPRIREALRATRGEFDELGHDEAEAAFIRRLSQEVKT